MSLLDLPERILSIAFRVLLYVLFVLYVTQLLIATLCRLWWLETTSVFLLSALMNGTLLRFSKVARDRTS